MIIMSYIFKLLQPKTCFFAIDYILTLLDQQVIVLWLLFSTLHTEHHFPLMFGCLSVCKTISIFIRLVFWNHCAVISKNTKRAYSWLSTTISTSAGCFFSYQLFIPEMKLLKLPCSGGSNYLWYAPFCALITMYENAISLKFHFSKIILTFDSVVLKFANSLIFKSSVQS